MTTDLKEGCILAMMYDNGCEFLRGEIKESELKMKQKFINDVDYTCRWWKPKAIRRYKNIHTKEELKKNNYFIGIL